MSEEIGNIMEEARRTALSPQEKQEIKNHLAAFMRQHPIRQRYGFLPGLWAGGVGLAARWFARPQVRYGLLAGAVAVFGMSGVAFAAQRSLPGDPLYPVKTGVDEKVLAAMQFSDAAKASYDLQLVNTRFSEMEQLASKNALNDGVSSQERSLIAGHIADIKQRVASIAQNDRTGQAAQINADLQASLNANALVLREFAASRQDAAHSIDGLLSEIVGAGNDEQQSPPPNGKADDGTQGDKPSANTDSSAPENQDQGSAAVTVSSGEAAQLVQAKLAETEASRQEAQSLLLHYQPLVSASAYQKASADFAAGTSQVSAGQLRSAAADWATALADYQQAEATFSSVGIYLQGEAVLRNQLSAPSDSQEGEPPSGASGTAVTAAPQAASGTVGNILKKILW